MIHHKLKLQTLLFFLLFLSVIGSYDDSDYMLGLLEAITPTPPGWSNGTRICDWTGVECRSGSGYVYVTTIKLESLSLSGTLPSGLNSLNSLTYLDLHNNSFTGPLPSLANLTSLTYVDLSRNKFTSIPPDCFQGLTSLQILYMSYNNLDSLGVSNTGVLPNGQLLGMSGTLDVLSSMDKLNDVRLQGNKFTGSIPDLSNCTQLVELQLQSNQLTGVVPPSLMNLSWLETVYLEGNLLQGPVPVFGKGVKGVTLGSNRFCRADPGPCDQRVTTLLEIAASFEYPLHLAESWVGNDPCHDWFSIVCTTEGKIRTVNLTNQNLNGTISAAFANLKDLRNLYLNGNNLMRDS